MDPFAGHDGILQAAVVNASFDRRCRAIDETYRQFHELKMFGRFDGLRYGYKTAASEVTDISCRVRQYHLRRGSKVAAIERYRTVQVSLLFQTCRP
jgi:hypothetical protein